MDGAESPGPEAPAGQAEAAPRPIVEPGLGDDDCVITTVVDGSGPGAGAGPGVDAGGVSGRPQPAVTQPAVTQAAGGLDDTDGGAPPASPVAVDEAAAGRVAAMAERLAPLEGLAEAVTALRQSVRQELERCAGVLFSHDRALAELNERLAAFVGRVDHLEAGPPGRPAAPPATELYEQALGHVLERMEALERRLQVVASGEAGARVAGLEERLGALEPLVPVVQALRVTVRAGEDRLAEEIAARQGSDDGAGLAGGPPPAALDEVSGRLAAVEGKVAPLEKVSDDVAALSRIVRRELEAVTADTQARDQMLRRALQKEIERLQASTEDREVAVRETAQRMELLERRVRGAAETHDDALTTVTRRLEAIESRLVSVDALADDIDTLRSAARRELERLRASAQAHEQAIAETVKRFVALDGRVSRLDTLPAEIDALRSAARQEAGRARLAGDEPSPGPEAAAPAG